MASVNHCVFIGNLGRDPEVKYMPSGDAACNISIACSETWIDKKSGEKKEKTEWVPIEFFGKIAEIVGQYCKKGSSIYVEGRFSVRKYTDKDGVEKYATSIKGDRMQLLGGRPADEGQGAPAQRQAAPAGRPAAGGARPAADDDIPF